MLNLRTVRHAMFAMCLAMAPAVYAQAPSVDGMVVDVRNGDQTGKLVVKDTELAFESLSDAKRSRNWKYSDVRELSKRGRKELRVRPFRGDRYDFQFPDRGMRDKLHDVIAQRILAARQGRKQ